MNGKFRLKEMAISGFRGFSTRQKFDLSKPFILLTGPNGTGKSSLLTAIEWCIYGDQVANINRTSLRERKNWAIVNKRSNQALVTLILQSSQEMITLRRSSKGSLVMELDNGTKIKNKGKIWSYLGAELEDFFSSVHLHQESIRDLIISPPTNRRQSFYRLLGLSDMQNTLDAISLGISYLNRAIKDKFSSPYMDLETRLETKWKDLHRRKTQKEEKGEKFGLSPKDFTSAKAQEIAENIRNKIIKLAKQFQLDLVNDMGQVNDLEGRERFLDHLRQQIRKLRNQNPSTLKLNQLRDRKSKLEGYNSTFENLKNGKQTWLNQLERIKAERLPFKLKELNKPQRIFKQLEKILANTELKLEQTREALSSSNILAGLVSDALRFIQTKDQISFCPVCGQSANKSRIEEHLRQKSEEMGQKKSQLANKIIHLEKELKALKKTKDSVKDLIDNLNRIWQRRKKGIKKLREIFEINVKSDEDPAKVTAKKIANLDKQLKEIRTKVNSYNKQFDKIEDEAEKLKVIDDVLKSEEEIKKLGQISKLPALKRIRKIRVKAHQLVKELNILQSILANALRQKASNKLQAARDEIEEIFEKLTARADYPKLVVDPEDFEVWAKDGQDGAPASTFYNQGDMNQAALSIFFGLANQVDKSHRLEFVILDDPSQSLGSDYKKSLAKLINDEVCKHSQVVVSTMDKEFIGALEKHIIKKKSLLKFEGWDPERGPKIIID